MAFIFRTYQQYKAYPEPKTQPNTLSTTQREGRRYREPSAYSAMKPRPDGPVAGVDGDILRGMPWSQEIESPGVDYTVKPT